MKQNFFTRAASRRKMTLATSDVALIFKEDGHLDLSFPELEGKEIPGHIMAALALSNAILDDDFFAKIQDSFEQSVFEELDLSRQEDDNKKPHLTIVS